MFKRVFGPSPNRSEWFREDFIVDRVVGRLLLGLIVCVIMLIVYFFQTLLEMSDQVRAGC